MEEGWHGGRWGMASGSLFIKRPCHSQACMSGPWKKLGGRVWKERPPLNCLPSLVGSDSEHAFGDSKQ